MTKYRVTIGVSYFTDLDVEASSEEEAAEIAVQEFGTIRLTASDVHRVENLDEKENTPPRIMTEHAATFAGYQGGSSHAEKEQP